MRDHFVSILRLGSHAMMRRASPAMVTSSITHLVIFVGNKASRADVLPHGASPAGAYGRAAARLAPSDGADASKKVSWARAGHALALSRDLPQCYFGLAAEAMMRWAA